MRIFLSLLLEWFHYRHDTCIGWAMIRLLPLVFVLVAFSAAAANNDDGFVWVDANTKIKLKPIGKTAGSATAGATKAPEPQKEEKKEKAKK